MKRVIGCGLAALCVAAQAQVWAPAGETADGVNELDLSSIRVQGHYIKAWSRFTFNAPTVGGRNPTFKYQSYKALDYYDCKNQTWATKQASYYGDASGAGGAVYSFNTNEALLNFADPIPGTLSRILLDRVCAGH